MKQRPKAVLLDVDPESLARLREALPEWDFRTADEGEADTLGRDWQPTAASLVVVGPCARHGGAVGVCRRLRSQGGRVRTPLLVLVPIGQEALVRPVLTAGADHCLVLPVQAADLDPVVEDARAEDRKRRLDRDRYASAWQDDGGEG